MKSTFAIATSSCSHQSTRTHVMPLDQRIADIIPIPSSDGFATAPLISYVAEIRTMNRSAGVRVSFIGLAAALLIVGGIVMTHASMVATPAGGGAPKPLHGPFSHPRA